MTTYKINKQVKGYFNNFCYYINMTIYGAFSYVALAYLFLCIELILIFGSKFTVHVVVRAFFLFHNGRALNHSPLHVIIMITNGI